MSNQAVSDTESTPARGFFLTPASGTKAQTNLAKTIRSPVTFDAVSSYIKDTNLAARLRALGAFGVWGLKKGGGQASSLRKMKFGDIVAFYMQDQIGFVGNAVGWEENPKLADTLWPHGKVQELVFFLQNVRETHVPFERYKFETGYRGPPEKFQPVTPPNKRSRKEVLTALGLDNVVDEVIEDRTGEENYLLLKTELGSDWPDVEGEEYHFGSNVTNEKQLVAGSHVLFERSLDEGLSFIGYGRITSVRDAGSAIGKSGKSYLKKIAYLDKQSYVKFDPPRKRSPEVDNLLGSLRTYNAQNSIVTITKQVFDQITGLSTSARSVTNQQLSRLRRLYVEFQSSGGDPDWLHRIEGARQKYFELLKARNFAETGVLSISDARQIGQELRAFSKNTALEISLSKRLSDSDLELRVFCERLRSLLFGEDDLPLRIEGFDELPLVGRQTVTQFLSFHYPERYPMVSAEHIQAILPPITDDQLDHAFETFNYPEDLARRISEHTRHTLAYMRIFEEIKEELGLPDFIHLNMFLMYVFQNPPGSQPAARITLEKLVQDTLVEEDFYRTLETELVSRKQVVLFGPPGTSKTFIATKFAEYFSGNEEHVSIVQFHPSYSYEDFVEGIRPELVAESKQVTYSVRDGILKKLAGLAEDDLDNNYVIIIDEINRGNIPRIFGELIYCLEYRNEGVTLTYTPDKKFQLPSNLFLIGTMNSADRSIALVDYALRRRFSFFKLKPDEQILSKWLRANACKIDVERVLRLFRELNSRIRDDQNLGEDFQIGHTYFMIKELDEAKLSNLWRFRIRPLLEEYYFEDRSKLSEFTKLFEEVVGQLEKQ